MLFDTAIYILSDPLTSEVRYVGQSGDPYARLCQHLNDRTDSPKAIWIRYLRSRLLFPTMTIIEFCHWSVANEQEQLYIRMFSEQGCALLNVKDPITSRNYFKKKDYPKATPE